MPAGLFRLKGMNFADPSMFIGDKCKKCLLRKGCIKCYGMSFIQTGNPAYVSPFNCAAYKIQVLANCVLQEKMMERDLLNSQEKKNMANVLRAMRIIFNHSSNQM